MTYKEVANKYLEDYGLSIGDTILINKKDITYEGILLDRAEDDPGPCPAGGAPSAPRPPLNETPNKKGPDS